MKSKKIIKIFVIVVISGVLVGGGIGLYMFYMPHRDVTATVADFSLTGSQIVSEYLTDREAANQKYLAEDGDSKILEITGKVSNISEDFDGQKVVLLKTDKDNAGVSATFTPETNKDVNEIELGQTITLKGVIRSGASYDQDLEMYEHVIIEKSSIVKK